MLSTTRSTGSSSTAATPTNRVSRSGDDRHGRKPRRTKRELPLITLLGRSGFCTVLVGKQGRASKSRDERLRELGDAPFGHAADHHIAQPIARP